MSVGIAIYPAQAQSVSELLKRSDEEMYAVKRQRPLMPGGFAAARLTSDDRVASIVGDLVPILVSSACMDDKLRAAAHRLAMRGGYAAVNFEVIDESSGAVVAHNAFVKAPDQLVDAWRREQFRTREHALGRILDETRASVIMDDLSRAEHLTETQRELAIAAGIHSGISVPLITDGVMVAVMSIGSNQLAAFGSHDAEVLLAVASQLAPLIRMVRRSDDERDARAA